MIRDFYTRMIFRVLCILFYFLSIDVSAQPRFADDLNVSVDYHYGFLLPEYSSLLYLAKDNIHSSSFNISKKTTGRNLWEQAYNYPEYGLSVFYSTLGNDEIHGREFSVFPYFRLDILTRKRFDIYNETGIGVSYVTRKFHLEDNYLNVAVGTHLNIHFNLKLGVEYKMPGKIKLHSGFSFDHFSNANAKEPNLGLNYATLYAGLKYRVGDESEKQLKEYADHEQDHHYEFIYSIGRKHPRAIGSEAYLTSSATLEFKWELFRALHIGVGADLFYDGATEAEMLTLELKNHKGIDDFRSGIHFSQELVYNKFSLIIQEGFYLLLTDRVDQHVMYNRGIFRYRISNRFFVQLAMKSHLHILDYPEFGLGIRW